MKPEQILEKLATLDPANKDHWNQDGQPRLGVVGEGVTRAEILAAAPLFSRANAQVPSVEELPHVKTASEEVEELQLKIDEANIALKDALKAQADANAQVKACQDRLEQIRDDQRNSDKRSDTEINQDLIYADLDRRMEKAQAHKQLRQIMEINGIPSEDVHLLTIGPADRAIARRNIENRRGRGLR